MRSTRLFRGNLQDAFASPPLLRSEEIHLDTTNIGTSPDGGSRFLFSTNHAGRLRARETRGIAMRLSM
jgi:hypothetical protein